MLDENKLILNSTDKILLYEIYKQLVLLNTNIETLAKTEKTNENNSVKEQFSSMKRTELMKLVSELDDKPEGWSKLSNKELIKLLER